MMPVSDMVLVPTSARSMEAETSYQLAKEIGVLKPLDQEPRLIQYKHWYLIANRFPIRHDIWKCMTCLCPSGAATRHELTAAALVNYKEILDELSNQYDLVFENFAHRRSVLTLYHLHLARYYKTREEFKQ